VGADLALLAGGGGHGGGGHGGGGHGGGGHGGGRFRGRGPNFYGGSWWGPDWILADGLEIDEPTVDDVADAVVEKLHQKKTRAARRETAVGALTDGFDLLGVDPQWSEHTALIPADDLHVLGAVVTLADLLPAAEKALAEAKQRAGSIPEFFGRFRDAEEELRQLKQAPDQEDTRKRAALLTQALQMVQKESLPLWLMIPAIGAGGLALLGAVLRRVTQNMIPAPPILAIQGAARAATPLAGLVAVGGAGVFAAQQLLATRPSSKTGLELQYDVEASRMKAQEDLTRTMAEQDLRDTATLEQQTRDYAQKKAIERATSPNWLPLSNRPEWAPKPGKPDERRFGYWKEGKFVEVPLNTPVVLDGHKGQYDNNGNFIPFAA
jgi:hypothetical protein